LRELALARERRVPFLDALRSVAILLVINQHAGTVFARTYGATGYTAFPLTANGWVGVDLFLC
jgi:peptidoglycan/LPS O-acetylase OafA/YrhL